MRLVAPIPMVMASFVSLSLMAAEITPQKQANIVEVTLPPQISEFVEELEQLKAELQGGAIAILHKDKVIYKTTFGRQKNKEGLITPDTLFALASVSKPVAVAAVALLCEEGRVKLDEKHTLPFLKNPVSLAHILSHTTGYHFSGNTQIEQGQARQKILSTLQKQIPKCQPGKCYSYSNITFSLVEESLNIHQLSLQEALANLRVKLGTPGVQMVPVPPQMELAFPHTYSDPDRQGGVSAQPFPPYYPIATPAAAGIFASLNGLIEVYKLSFGYRPDLISSPILDKLHTPLLPNRNIDFWNIRWPCDVKKIDSRYALGWRVLKSKQYPGTPFIFHGGFINGAHTLIGFLPSEEMGIIILVNQSSAAPLEKGMKFWGQFFKKRGEGF